MRFKFCRIFEVDVPDEEIIKALEERIDEWMYEEGDRAEMGISDVLYRLDEKGFLSAALPSEYPELVDGEFLQDFYTVEELKNELS